MQKNIDFYISKGFDLKTAEYFASGRKKIISVIPNPDFTLTLLFDNGEKRLYNVAPLLKPNTVFEKFAEIENFKRVYLDETSNISWDIDPNIDSNVVWSNKVDICSDECYINSKPI